MSQTDVLFGVRRHKAVVDELAGLEVEFAQGFGVFAAGRERYQAADVAGVEAVQAVGDPLLLVLFGERVVVEDGLPVRVGAQIAGQTSAAQDAAYVLGVLPGVVDCSCFQYGNR